MESPVQNADQKKQGPISIKKFIKDDINGIFSWYKSTPPLYEYKKIDDFELDVLKDNNLPQSVLHNNEKMEYSKYNEDVNLVFHNVKDDIRTLFQIKVSPIENFLATLLEVQLKAYCYAKERGKKISKIIIYRPLTGVEVTMHENQINFKKIEEIVENKN